MFAELVKLNVPDDFTRADALADAYKVLPGWQANPDLIRKHFLWGADGNAYGFYLWTSKEAAKKAHSEEWLDRTVERFGARAEILDFDVMLLLDNEAESVEEFAPAA